MNIWLSLMLVALLSKRDMNRVAGRTSRFGGVCYILVRRPCYCTSKGVISYNYVGVATSDNFIEHGQDVVILFQSCRIGCGSYEDKVILPGCSG